MALANSTNALQLYQTSTQQKPIPTFARSLDSLLGGGIHTGPGILELCGLPGAGKTQLCMQLCVNVQIPTVFGGLSRKAVYIDTEGSFLVERMAQIADGLCNHLRILAKFRGNPEMLRTAENLSVRGLLDGIYVFRVFDHIELLAAISTLDDFLQSQKETSANKSNAHEVGLILLDSITFPYRHAFADFGTANNENVQTGQHRGVGRISVDNNSYGNQMAARTSQMLTIANNLNYIAHKYNIAVVVTNQMTTKFVNFKRGDIQGPTQSRLEPALGESWAHVPSCRVEVKQLSDGLNLYSGSRVATILKSNYAPQGSAMFEVKSEGIRDVASSGVQGVPVAKTGP